MLFSWFELLLMVGVLQATIAAIALLINGKPGLQRTLLSLVLLCFGAVCVKRVIYSSGLDHAYPSLDYIPLAFETALPPLAYLYLACLAQPKKKLSPKALLHLAPFAAFLLYAVFVYATVHLWLDPAGRDNFLATIHHREIKAVEDYLTLVMIAIYLALSSLELGKYTRATNNVTSDNNDRAFRWLRSVRWLSSVLLIFLSANMVLDRSLLSDSNAELHWELYFIYLAAVVYYLGFTAHRLPSHIDLTEATTQPSAQPTAGETKDLKPLAQVIENTIVHDQLFLNPSFSLRDLSDILQVNQSTLSQAINKEIGMSFRELINRHRIVMAKQLLRTNKGSKTAILAQALECGFNSEASFYRVFKKHTGMSPTQFLKTAR
jgi:AraC-like DNA-binding protein